MDDPAREHEEVVKSFLDVARRYCAEIERADQVSDIGLLQALNGILAELYWRAQALPDVDPTASQDDDVERITPEGADVIEKQAFELHQDLWAAVAEQLRNKLGRHDIYLKIFDPFEFARKGEPPYDNSLSNDLAEIYADLKEDFFLDEQALELGQHSTERLWHWRQSFRMHWGRTHLLSALNSIGWLVYSYWDEYDEEWKSTDEVDSGQNVD